MIYENASHKRRKSRFQDGQSLVEVAISLVFFFYFMFGVFDIGRLYFTYIALEDSAGEAAVFMSIQPTCATATECANPNNGEYRARNASGQVLDWNEATVNVTYPTVGKSIGNLVKVEITYDFELFTPIISEIIGGGTLTITAEASQVILTE